jgi:photosystem II stability/assembly factor-like uncharacterized protein
MSAVSILASPVLAQQWNLTSAPGTNWSCVASSSDGTRVVAVAGTFFDEGPIYTSADSGVTWIAPSAPCLLWSSVASSADGTNLVAVAIDDGSGSGGQIYTSADAGATWTQASNAPQGYYWSAVACSADGSR